MTLQDFAVNVARFLAGVARVVAGEGWPRVVRVPVAGAGQAVAVRVTVPLPPVTVPEAPAAPGGNISNSPDGSKYATPARVVPPASIGNVSNARPAGATIRTCPSELFRRVGGRRPRYVPADGTPGPLYSLAWQGKRRRYVPALAG